MILTYNDHEIEVEETENGIIILVNGNTVYESSRR